MPTRRKNDVVVVDDGRAERRAEYPLRVAYDAKAFVDSDLGGGKGAQLRTLLGELGEAFVGLAPRGRSYTSLPLLQKGTRRYLLWQQVWLPRLLAEVKAEIFLAPYNTAPLWLPAGTKLISVVHDLILFEPMPHASLRRRLRDAYRAMLMRRTIERSSLILTVSEFTAQSVRALYPRSKLQVIPCTLPASWYVRERAIAVAEREGYVLLVTSNVPHKNVPRALEAFARYRQLDPSSKLTLRLVGVSSSAAHFRSMAERLGMAESLVIEPFLDEADLQGLYQRARCVLIPSQMEGFGIPALEAMVSGAPLVSSKTWSLPEVGGDVPVYVDPVDVEAMARALLRVCTDAAFSEELSRRGLERAEMFHPDKVGAEVSRFWSELPAMYRSWTAR